MILLLLKIILSLLYNVKIFKDRTDMYKSFKLRTDLNRHLNKKNKCNNDDLYLKGKKFIDVIYVIKYLN